MRKLLLVLVTAGLFASLAFAQDNTQTVITGTVVSATNDALVVDTATGRMTFKLDSMLDRVKYNDLKPGSRIEVTHKMDTQGVNEVVTDVTVLSQPNTSTPPATTTTTNDQYAANNRLPATGSPFGTLAVVSLGALLAGLGLRARATRLDS
jgi:opacity protein-like surface antigen